MPLTKSICDRCLKILQHLSSSNLPSLVLNNHLEKLISLLAIRPIKQADVGSPYWKNLGSLIEMSREAALELHTAHEVYLRSVFENSAALE